MQALLSTCTRLESVPCHLRAVLATFFMAIAVLLKKAELCSHIALIISYLTEIF